MASPKENKLRAQFEDLQDLLFRLDKIREEVKSLGGEDVGWDVKNALTQIDSTLDSLRRILVKIAHEYGEKALGVKP